MKKDGLATIYWSCKTSSLCGEKNFGSQEYSENKEAEKDAIKRSCNFMKN